ncbi:MAG: F0F1 ATP synthase subunit A [Thermoleophilaceae bacterium]
MNTIKNMSTKAQVGLGLGVVVTLIIVMLGIFGNAGRNNEFQPQNEFKLDPWIPLKLGPLDMSINKGVMYVFIAAALTTWIMVRIAKRMTERPNNTQTAVEAAYDFAANQIVGSNIKDRKLATKWFPFIATLFFFILVSNLIGYIPLPTNTEHTFSVAGLEIPSFAIYAATANVSIPLILTLMVVGIYHYEGIKAKGPIKYVKGWLPSGTPKAITPLILGIEVISQLVRVISLSVRLFANLLAGHLLILFMGGGLIVILGIAAIGVLTLPVAIAFFMFEVVLIAGLQAFIFATLTSIYLGEAVAEGH